MDERLREFLADIAGVSADRYPWYNGNARSHHYQRRCPLDNRQPLISLPLAVCPPRSF